MPRTALILCVLIASPSDVNEERDVATNAIHQWNAVHSRDKGIMLEPVRWETHSYPASGDRPQAIVNRQIVDAGDILIGIFGSRLGTPTGEAQSGTIEEIERFRSAGKYVALYFSTADVPRTAIREQFNTLEEYQRERRKDTLYATFSTLDELRQRVTQHLPLIVSEVSKSLEPPLNIERQQPTPPSPVSLPVETAALILKEQPRHNMVFLGAAFVKIAYSGRSTDGMHSFSEVAGLSKGDMIGLVTRFRNEAIYGEDIKPIRGARAHLKLFDNHNQEIGTGFSAALWLGHGDDTFDLIPNGPGGSVLVCWGTKTKANVSWKTRTGVRLHDNEIELPDGYPSKANVTILDSKDRPLLPPINLEITKENGDITVMLSPSLTP